MVANGGIGYKKGDYLTINGGSPPALLYVSDIDASGGILSVTVLNSAVYLSPPPALATSTTVTGDGTGATFYQIISTCCDSYTSVKIFNYTGNEQQFIVPEGVTSIIAHLYGGGGGGGYGRIDSKGGGGGAYIVGELNVTPGSTVTLSVAGGASAVILGNNAGGYGGGGNGARLPFNIFNAMGGSGGGGSKLIYNNTDLLIAGGGGGGGGSFNLTTNIAGIGGGGGASTGGNGEGTYFGSGGSNNTGGAGGINGDSGIKGKGADGKQVPFGFFGFSTAAGGGGYYGGGAAGYVKSSGPFGSEIVTQGGGGGGGSSYYDPTIVRSVYNPPATIDGTSAGSKSTYYQNGIGIGGVANNNGGNGMIVLIY
jgi:hypothetical protein